MLVVHYEFSTMANAPARSPLANAIGWLAVMATALFGVDIAAVDGAGGNLHRRGRSVFLPGSRAAAGCGRRTCSALCRPGGAWRWRRFAAMASPDCSPLLFHLRHCLDRRHAGAVLRPRAWRPETGAAHIGPGKTWSGAVFGGGCGRRRGRRHGAGPFAMAAGVMIPLVALRAGDLRRSSATCSNPG